MPTTDLSDDRLVQLPRDAADHRQQWRFIAAACGTWMIESRAHPGQVITLPAHSQVVGASVGISDQRGTIDQRWVLIPK